MDERLDITSPDGRVVTYQLNQTNKRHIIHVPGDGRVEITTEELIKIVDQATKTMPEVVSEHSHKKGHK